MSTDEARWYDLVARYSGDFDTWQFDVVARPPTWCPSRPRHRRRPRRRTTTSRRRGDAPPDRDLPSPTRASSVNGPVTVRGAFFGQPPGHQGRAASIGPSQPTGSCSPDPYSWEYLFDSAGYANSTYATESPPGQQHLEAQRLRPGHRHRGQRHDHVGRQTYYFFVDQALDKPRVTVISPPAGHDQRGGPLLDLGHRARRRRAVPTSRCRSTSTATATSRTPSTSGTGRPRAPTATRTTVSRGRPLVPRGRDQPVVAADQRLRRDVPDRGGPQRRHHRAGARGGHQGRRPHAGHRGRYPGVLDPPRRHDPAHREPQPRLRRLRHRASSTSPGRPWTTSRSGPSRSATTAGSTTRTCRAALHRNAGLRSGHHDRHRAVGAQHRQRHPLPPAQDHRQRQLPVDHVDEPERGQRLPDRTIPTGTPGPRATSTAQRPACRARRGMRAR